MVKISHNFFAAGPLVTSPGANNKSRQTLEMDVKTSRQQDQHYANEQQRAD